MNGETNNGMSIHAELASKILPIKEYLSSHNNSNTVYFVEYIPIIIYSCRLLMKTSNSGTNVQTPKELFTLFPVSDPSRRNYFFSQISSLFVMVLTNTKCDTLADYLVSMAAQRNKLSDSVEINHKFIWNL